mmetsp:Transcript_33619/g.100237  ORF Transcript_33619/g.100237 Transcript_33619/m.100237 type:complete len:1186 (-) Transcript_33619:149-3706(-)
MAEQERPPSPPTTATSPSCCDVDVDAKPKPMPKPNRKKHSVILFYKYAPLSDDPSVLELYASATRRLCASLQLNGRVLLGLSRDAEGINGTLAGMEEDVSGYVAAMLGRDAYALPNLDDDDDDAFELDGARLEAVRSFWKEAEHFATMAGVPVPVMDSPEDFKWSSSEGGEGGSLFPDLNVKCVKEIIGTGGVLSSVKLDSTARGYLTPEEWHEEMKALTTQQEKQQQEEDRDGSLKKKDDDTVLIDCRNHKEYAIGRFPTSVDPNTKSFSEFPRWVSQNASALQGKRVLMYCTGGIRCEKASEYVRRETGATEVRHLRGGIHKYLDAYGRDGYWRGKNFVFDKRIGTEAPDVASSPAAVPPAEGASAEDATNGRAANGAEDVGAPSGKVDERNVVGRCLYCSSPHDEFDPSVVCTVCREPVLACDSCRRPSPRDDTASDAANSNAPAPKEYHCSDHFHLRRCYFTDLSAYTADELRSQLAGLEEQLDKIAVGRRHKGRRKSLHRQMERVRVRLEELLGSSSKDGSDKGAATVCRNCGDVECKGDCWGFHGLGRKQRLDEKGGGKVSSTVTPNNRKDIGHADAGGRGGGGGRKRLSSNQRPSKVRRRNRDIAEITALRLSQPPSTHRDPSTSLRCPPPVVRVLQSSVKGRWVGKSALDVLREEFADLRDSGRANDLLSRGLIRLNGRVVKNDAAVGLDGTGGCGAVGAGTRLKNMDTIERVVHWHEPPVIVPERIGVAKVLLPECVTEEYRLGREEEGGNGPKDGDDDASGGGGNGKPPPNLAVYCLSKPSTVPVHPAGPYLSNSLTLMAEAQEGLSPRSLRPCHRLDRPVSGLTLCCSSPDVARLIQGRMSSGERGAVRKLYVARVKGKFPRGAENDDDGTGCGSFRTDLSLDECASWRWLPSVHGEATSATATPVEVDAPIDVIDPSEGLRAVRGSGKPSQSRFRYLAYDESEDASLVACSPLTGRGHQLRVHLAYLGYPICGDAQYGGGGMTAVGNGGSRGGKDAAVEAVLRAAEGESASSPRWFDEHGGGDDVSGKSEGRITDRDAAAAVEACRCCAGGGGGSGDEGEDGPRRLRSGVEESFNSAQLLDGGHSIDLHALRYGVRFDRRRRGRKSKKRKQSDGERGVDADADATAVGGEGRKAEANSNVGEAEREELATVEFSSDIPPWAAAFGDVDIGWLE